MAMMGTRLVLMVAASVLVAGGGMAAPVTGDAALAAIRDAMAAAGAPPPSMAAPLRALPDCDHTPDVTPRSGDWAVVDLTCRAPGWTRALRTGAPAGISTRAAPSDLSSEQPPGSGPLIATLQRPLQRGQRVTADDLVLGQVQGVDPAQAITDPVQAVGRRLRRALGPGQPLLERHLDPAQDIEPGQRVTVMLDVGAISIRQDGIAMTGGRAGDVLRLQPAAGRAPVEAVIIGPGLVRVRR